MMDFDRTVGKVFDRQAAKSRLVTASWLPVEWFLKLDPFCDQWACDGSVCHVYLWNVGADWRVHIPTCSRVHMLTETINGGFED